MCFYLFLFVFIFTYLFSFVRPLMSHLPMSPLVLTKDLSKLVTTTSDPPCTGLEESCHYAGYLLCFTNLPRDWLKPQLMVG